MKTLTPYFPHTIKPVRKGVYETKHWGPFSHRWICSYSLWDGTYWRMGEMTPKQASVQPFRGTQNKEWRGFTTRQE